MTTMTSDEYNIILPELIKNAETSIKNDGYARMGKVFSDVTKNGSWKNSNAVDKSFFNSLSALIIRKAKYIREPIFDKEHNIDDYNVLLNPTNKSFAIQRFALIATLVFSTGSLVIQIINLCITIKYHSDEKQRTLQQQQSNLRLPLQQPNTIIIYQNQTYNDTGKKKLLNLKSN